MMIPKHPLVMRIQKLSLNVEIDKEITEIFKIKGKAQFPKRQWKHESNFCCRKVKSPYCTFFKLNFILPIWGFFGGSVVSKTTYLLLPHLYVCKFHIQALKYRVQHDLWKYLTNYLSFWNFSNFFNTHSLHWP